MLLGSWASFARLGLCQMNMLEHEAVIDTHRRGAERPMPATYEDAVESMMIPTLRTHTNNLFFWMKLRFHAHHTHEIYCI